MPAAESTNPSLTSSQVAPDQFVLAGDTTLLNAEAAAIWEQALANLLSDPNREALFAAVFGRAGTDAATFAANLQALLAALGGAGRRSVGLGSVEIDSPPLGGAAPGSRHRHRWRRWSGRSPQASAKQLATPRLWE